MSRAQAVAAAERGAKVEVTVHGASYEEILALPHAELLSTLAHGEYTDIQGLCKFIGINAKGQRAELERRVLEHVELLRASANPAGSSPSSSGSAPGRNRSPKRGAAASALRAAADKDAKEHKPRVGGEKTMETDPRTMNAAEYQAFILESSKASASAGPMSWPPPPGMPQYASLATPVHRPGASLPSLSPDIASAKERVAEMRAKLASQNASGEPTNSDLMNAIIGMKEQMALKEDIEVAKLETVKEIRSEIAPLRESIADVDTKAAQALDETKMLHQRMVTAEQGQIREFDRVGRLESEVQELKKQLASVSSSSASSSDPAFRRISFLGFPAGSSRDLIITEMEKFATQKLPLFKHLFAEIFYKGPRSKREPTNNGFLEFSSSDVRDAVLKHLGKDPTITVSGSKVDIRPSKTQADGHRDYVLREAASRVKAHAAAKGKSVETKKAGNDRCVKVDGAVAFQQASRKSTEISKYSAPFTDLELP